MKQVKLAEAKAKFSEMVQRAMLGEEIIVTHENRAVVRIIAMKPARRTPGTGKGIWMSEEVESPLEDFKEYS